MQHSKFDPVKFNAMVRGYNESGRRVVFPEISDYADFCDRYPITGRDDLHTISEQLVEGRNLQDCYVISTSGTTGAPLVLINRIWRDTSDGSYPKQFFDYLFENVFDPKDVVANLCFPGGLGLLYEGMSKVLEPMGITILPIGRLDSFNNDRNHFEMFQRLGLNTLVGSPSSIAEFARTAHALGVKLDICKLVFSAESFHRSKRDFVKNIWPEAQFFSLYGATEFGLACIGTPSHAHGHHHLLEDWFLVETDMDGSLYVTDLKGPLIPIIRYRIGDRGSLTVGDDGTTQLVLGGRCDSAFNFAGALLKYDSICERIRKAAIPIVARDAAVQLILKTTENGKDLLSVVIDHDFVENDEIARGVWNAVHSIRDISEDIARGVVELRVHARSSLHITRRSKRPDIVDLREYQP
ncbi:hypothetical protein [Agrobacterium rosae]|uniref:hypothetical protein n=1 Tax=Agrobacterium rosae TaxID=1972867 RepID=UPI003A8036FE